MIKNSWWVKFSAIDEYDSHPETEDVDRNDFAHILIDRIQILGARMIIVTEKQLDYSIIVSRLTIALDEGRRYRTMQMKSGAFEEGGSIPKKYTCDGQDVSPPLSWSDPPKGTKSFALIADDPDAPVGTWVHWVLYGLAPEITKLNEGIPPDNEVLGGARQGRNDFGNIGYGGPCPPPGRPHHYYFKLYALDMKLSLAAGARKAELLKAIEGHILGEGQLMGRYGRS